MAPSKPTSKKSNKTGGSSNTKKSSTLKSSKSRVSKSSASSTPAIQQKSKRPSTQTQADKRKKPSRRHYTEKELGIPALNTITPVGVAKPRAGKRTGKVYVDDAASMMTIMAMVQAEKEGQIESKMLRARQLEEIRRLKQEEQEAREEERKGKLEDVKDSLRKKRRRTTGSTGKTGGDVEGESANRKETAAKKGKKRVSFK